MGERREGWADEESQRPQYVFREMVLLSYNADIVNVYW